MLLVSPLVALARQQAMQLSSLQCGQVVLWAGGGMDVHGAQVQKRFLRKETKACIISPESLQFETIRDQLRQWNPNFFVVDECHCVWEWGQKFRISFQKLPKLIHDLKIPKSLWLTATLPPPAREMLKAQMGCELIEIGDFSFPPRLSFRVLQVSPLDRLDALSCWIENHTQPGIVFVNTREQTQRVCRALHGMRRTPIGYHAGLSKEERMLLEKTISQGGPEIVVATSAFGMGMDFSHFRWVVFWQPPSSVLSLMQMVGRVTRRQDVDSQAIVFWSEEDFQVKIFESAAEKNEVMRVGQFLNSKLCRVKAVSQCFGVAQEVQSCERCDRCLLG